MYFFILACGGVALSLIYNVYRHNQLPKLTFARPLPLCNLEKNWIDLKKYSETPWTSKHYIHLDDYLQSRGVKIDRRLECRRQLAEIYAASEWVRVYRRSAERGYPSDPDNDNSPTSGSPMSPS